MPDMIPALIRFDKMHFLLTSENEYFHEIERDGITSFPGIHVWRLFARWTSKSQDTSLPYYKTANKISFFAGGRPHQLLWQGSARLHNVG